MSAIYKRELRAYFTSPIAYIVILGLAFYSSLTFTALYESGYAEITYVFQSLFEIILFMMPIITMRTMSDDRKQKTDQVLLTSPVSLSGIVMGKYLAALTIYAVATIAPSIIYQIIFAYHIETVQWLIFIGNIIGTMFLGAALAAIGIFVSSLTESQVVAAVGSFAISFALIILDTLAAKVENIAFLATALTWVSFANRYQSFTSGVFDYSNIVFFLSLSALFLFLSTRMLEKRRWS